jgi:PAS domain S-box-containing protein
LERELKEAREHVKSMTEDFEATREELQSANEEVLSSNEELQSINEELETSKEELQSTNEELITINDELHVRNTDIKESADFAKAIVETIREPLIVLNADLLILSANHAFYTVFRLNQDTAEGHYLYEVGDSLFDIPDLRTQLKKVIAKNTGFLEFGILHDFKGIGKRVLQCNAMRMSGESGKKARVLLAIEDITERSVAEKALFVSEERFRHVSESGLINIMFFHKDGRIVDANSSFLDLVGYTETDLHTDLLRLRSITPREWVHEATLQLEKTDSKGKIGPYELEYIRKDKSRFWAFVVGARLENDLAVQFVIDITARKRTENELRRNEERYRIALEAAELVAWDWNLETGLAIWSPQQYSLFGLPPNQEERNLEVFLEYVHPDDVALVNEQMRQALKNGLYKADFRIIRSNDRQVRWMTLYGRVIEWDGSKPIRMTGVIFDITDHKQVQ